MTKNSFTKRLKRAFTITELVIVIAVIAVLAAVLVPTFSNVVDNAKESHDKQIVRSINTSLSAYTVENNGKKPATYEELMLILQEYNLTDKANPFLLADSLDQKNAHLVWYPNSNSVVLLKDNADDYVMNFSASEGLGNGVYVVEVVEGGYQAFGYILCTNGKYNYVANLYYDFYITAGGDITNFTYNADSIKQNVKNEAFANSIIAALSNSKVGYTASTEIKNSIINDVAVSSTATINIDTIAGDGASNEVKEQAVRATLATLTSVVNNSETATKLDGKDIKLTGVEGLTVDMAGVQTTAIGLNYRKDPSIKDDKTAPSTPNVDFGGLEITGLTIEENAFISSGANYQTASDNGYPGAAYMFTYGLFGSVFAAPGETVTIANLEVTGVNMNLNGATEMVGGVKTPTISDNAGIVVGFTQGNVVLKNITVDGQGGSFSGYDAVSGLVGRTYGNSETDTVTIENCVVKNVTINGQRRAAGFIGFASGVNVVIKDSSLENVIVNAKREDLNGIYFGAIGDFNSNVKSITLNNVTLTGIETNYSWKKADGSVLDAPPAKAVAPAGVGSYAEEYYKVGSYFVFRYTGAKANISITNCTVNGNALTIA